MRQFLMFSGAAVWLFILGVLVGLLRDLLMPEQPPEHPTFSYRPGRDVQTAEERRRMTQPRARVKEPLLAREPRLKQ